MGIFKKIGHQIDHAAHQVKHTVHKAEEHLKNTVNDTRTRVGRRLRGRFKTVTNRSRRGHKFSKSRHRLRSIIRVGNINKNIKIFKIPHHKFLDNMMHRIGKEGGSLIHKVDVLYQKLDDVTRGYSTMAIMALIPEIQIAKAVLQITNKIRDGEQPYRAIADVSMSILLSDRVLGQHLKTLKMGVSFFSNKTVQDKLLGSKTGKALMEKIKRRLPNNMRG